MLSHESNPEINRQLMQALEDTIDDGPWDKTLLLQTIGNKLKALRDKYKYNLDFGTEGDVVSEPGHLAERVAERAGQVEVYIALYNAKGNDMAKWSKCLQGLSANIITRPIYGNELDAKSRLRTKLHDPNEAYAVIYLDKVDILEPADKADVLRDRTGHELLSVREGSIDPKKITRFVHNSGQYLYKDGKLVKQDSQDAVDFI